MILGRRPSGRIATGSVIDDGSALSREIGDAIFHRPHLLAGVARPTRELPDDADGFTGAPQAAASSVSVT